MENKRERFQSGPFRRDFPSTSLEGHPVGFPSRTLVGVSGDPLGGSSLSGVSQETGDVGGFPSPEPIRS